MKEITSVQNPFIKRLILLREKSRNRKKEGVFVIEGEREIRLAIQGNYILETVLFQKEIFSEEKVKRLLPTGNKEIQTICISKDVYEKLTYRSSTEGIIAVAETKSHLLKDVDFKGNNPLVLVAEAPEKPGNIGALLRTADAAGIDAVLIANPKTDLYNPNIIRSSVGCLFTTSVAMGTTSEIISFLKEKNIKIFCAALSASKPYTEVSFKEASAIVVGTEDEGLTDEWLQNSHQNIIIPMEGVIDSMNVSVAAAVLIFEAKRQREV
ncbi:TrmH family RNA methyltransferase [Capnocytophaga felis]|uniref:rRNA methyltransferase n=1 Tax=Capnocytophaga felis TaxID=2267611 RepID=A0A5M4B605_9FLAO|nr:RNA methyltransferase [Capnocytophaga felis]GET45051.1 rRNA methyltransferase [Capnocytophaga felis]GET47785.1 rRNA methyltransferase [Capnocytophaga felis]